MASGLPAERRTCNWWAASVLAATVLLVGHQRNRPLESRLYFVSQNVLSDGITGLIAGDRYFRLVINEVLLFYPFRALGVTNLGFRFAVYELHWPLSFSRRFSSSLSTQMIQCFPEGVLRE